MRKIGYLVSIVVLFIIFLCLIILIPLSVAGIYSTSSLEDAILLSSPLYQFNLSFLDESLTETKIAGYPIKRSSLSCSKTTNSPIGSKTINKGSISNKSKPNILDKKELDVNNLILDNKIFPLIENNLNYAKELTGNGPQSKYIRVEYDDGTSINIIPFKAKENENSFLYLYFSDSSNFRGSHLINISVDNGELSVSIFNEDGGMTINPLTNEILNTWGGHHSCNEWTCLAEYCFYEYYSSFGTICEWALGACRAFPNPISCLPLALCMSGVGFYCEDCHTDYCSWYPCQQDCTDQNYLDGWDYYCQNSYRYRHRWYHAYKCEHNNPGESGSCITDSPNSGWQDDTFVETCPYGCNYGTGNCYGATTCYGDGDCGDSGWIGSPSCSGDDVWQTWREYTCYNPGTESSYCDYDNDYILKQECTSGECSGGYCEGDESCEDPDYPWYCNDGCWGCELGNEGRSICCPDSGDPDWCCLDEGPYCDTDNGECDVCGGDYPYECNDGCWGCPSGGELCCPNSGDPDWCCYTEAGSVCMDNGDCCFPSTETCNNQDDDCDGTIDGFSEGCGQGACAGGTRACTAGSWSSCSTDGQASSETCNNQDDDCDGSVDESLTQECGIDVGVCAKGTQNCSAGEWGSCGGSYVGPTNEICNGLDDNCNSVTNEQNVCNNSIIINLEFPENNSIETMDTTPTFGFNITNINYTSLNCSLWLDDGTPVIYGSNNSIWISDVGISRNITANRTVLGGVYDWWINCTDGINVNTSEIFLLTMNMSKIETSLISPNEDINVSQNDFFDFTTEVCCYLQDCGEINVSLDPEFEKVEYTPSTETHCNENLCTETIYSGVRNVYEEGQWKKIEEANSLKGIWNIIIDEDPDFPVDVIDFNYSTITLDLSVSDNKLNEEVDLKVYNKYNKTQKPKNDLGREINKDKKIKIQISNEKIREIIDLSDTSESILGQEIKWGGASTTIQLQEPDTENLDDGYVIESYPTQNTGNMGYMSTANIYGDEYHSYLKFNLSSLPENNAWVGDATMYFYTAASCGGAMYNISLCNTSSAWDESTLIWNNKPSAEYCEFNLSNSIVDDTWINFTITELVNASYNSGMNNLSIVFIPLDTGSGWNLNLYTKEYSTPSKRPYLNITYWLEGELPQEKGLISTQEGETPFYTIDSNPNNITLNKDECQNITWRVNATGNISDKYIFFAYSNLTSDPSVSDKSSEINVTIQEKEIELISNLSNIYGNNTEAIFKFMINNTINSTDSFTWQLNTGESTINSTSEISLNNEEAIYVYVENNYSSTGSYNVTATTYTREYSDSETIMITLSLIGLLIPIGFRRKIKRMIKCKKGRIKLGLIMVFGVLLIFFIPLLVSPDVLNSESIIPIGGKIKEEINLDGIRIIEEKRVKEVNESPVEKTIPTYNFNQIETQTTTILDERTEQTCNKTTCEWTQTMGKRFHEYENDFYYFNEYITSQESQGNFNQESLDNTEVTLTPIINYQDQEIEITNLSSIIGNQLNYQTTIDQYRDNTKFSINFNTLENLNKIGFKITSNKEINYRTYNYTPEGSYNEGSFVQYEVTDLIIDELRYSFTDLIESDFEIEYDKRSDILWINLEGLGGNIDADPTYSFYSDNTDACLRFTGGSCDAINPVYNTSSTLNIKDDRTSALFAVKEVAFFMFNTSTIADDAILSLASIKFYAQGYVASRDYTPTYNVHYYSNMSYFGDLDCNDKAFTGEGTKDWGGTTGAKTHFVNVSNINVTGYTNYRLLDGWTPTTPQYAYIVVRTSEYTGTTSDPQLLIQYEIPEDNETLAREAIEEGINNSILSSPEIGTDQQIYIRYLDNEQVIGSFDKFTESGNQTWVFNYITDGESYTNITSLRNIVNIWENSSLSYEGIVNQVESFINTTFI
ncbi:DNRLRE domain-containing protein [archaeon]|nr:DNRLRE domain-containing protein [archaeon]